MPSIQARLFGRLVRLIVKRKDWGGREGLPRRARRIFGAPRIAQWWAARDMKIEQVFRNGIRGEWLMRASGHDRSAIILYIHGGGYVSCSPQTHRPISCALARRTGFRVFSVDYRSAPENPFPASIKDVFAAYRRLTETEPDTPIALAGDSAGGGLVLITMMKARDARLRLPSCGVCFSPWTDMTGSGGSVRANAERDQMFYPSTIEQFADVYLRDHDRSDPLVSPVFGDQSGFPPMLFHVSSTEILIDDSRRIHEQIIESGGDSTFELFDGMFHGWQMAAGLIPEADLSLEKAAAFIRSHTNAW